MGALTINVLAQYDLRFISGIIFEAVGGTPTVNLRAISTMQMEY
jgi:hypothetical protein